MVLRASIHLASEILLHLRWGAWVVSGWWTGAGDVEVDDGVVGPGEFGGVAVFDAVAGSEYGVQCVTCDVRGVADELGEVDVVHVVE